MLDRETIERIEELHAAVVRAEAEQRFGLLRGKRTRQVAEAEAAEQAFLNEHGFATYNDFRLRIRRSTVGADTGPAPLDEWGGDPGPRGNAVSWGAEASAAPASMFGAPAGAGQDRDIDREHGDDAPHGDRPQEGSDHMADSATSQASPAVPTFAPEPPAPVPTLGPESLAAPVAPPPVPTFVPHAGEDNVATATADFRRLTEPLFATLQSETDRFVAARIEAAEKQAADIVNRASREGAEILAKAARMHDAVRSLLDEVTTRAEAFLAHTEELPAQITQARHGVGADLQALRELADRAQGTAPATTEAPSSWATPARVAPPPVSAGAPAD